MGWYRTTSAITLAILMSCSNITASAQSALSNGTDEWTVATQMHGNNGEITGHVLVAPHSKLIIGAGGIEHGAGKFVATSNGKIVIACFTSDADIDFVALNVSNIEWDDFGRTKSITLSDSNVTFHDKTNTGNSLLQAPLNKQLNDDIVRIKVINDDDFVKELAGKKDVEPNVFLSFDANVKSTTIHKNISMFVSFYRCKVAQSGS